MLGLSPQASEAIRHISGQEVTRYAVILGAFMIGLAVGNGFTTNEALQGSAQYFVHRYCPKVAAKAAAGAAEKQREVDTVYP